MNRLVDRLGVDDCYLGKSPGVGKSQMPAIIKCHDETHALVEWIFESFGFDREPGVARIFSWFKFVQTIKKVAGHFHVHQNSFAASQIYENIFGTTFDREHFFANDNFFERLEISGILDGFGTFEVRTVVVAPNCINSQSYDMLLETIDCCLDFGEFRHIPTIMYNIRMRHILTATLLIAVLFVPWLMNNPYEANLIYSAIGRVENQLAAVITHSPKTVDSIKSHYAGTVSKGIFHTKIIPTKVRILLVPGHEPDFGGAEYASLKEREMTVELADNLQEFLGANERYQVFVTRDKNSWLPTFADYFKANWSEIISWKDGHKEEVARLTKLGEFHPVTPEVIHNDVPTDVALRLFGIGKWSNENDIDIVIHIHFNDDRGHSHNVPGDYSGFSIYVPQEQYYNSSTTMTLAQAIFGRLNKFNPVSNLPGESKGIVQDQNLIAVGAFNSLNAPSMLIEYGYIYESQFGNPELRNLAIKDLAFQTYLGLQDFFDERNPNSLASSFETLAMPHVWADQIVDKNAKAADIYSLQTALVLDGVYPPSSRTMNDCPRNGNLGNCTRTALEAFQKKRGIVGEKGIVGPKTLKELNSLYSPKVI